MASPPSCSCKTMTCSWPMGSTTQRRGEGRGGEGCAWLGVWPSPHQPTTAAGMQLHMLTCLEGMWLTHCLVAKAVALSKPTATHQTRPWVLLLPCAGSAPDRCTADSPTATVERKYACCKLMFSNICSLFVLLRPMLGPCWGQPLLGPAQQSQLAAWGCCCCGVGQCTVEAATCSRMWALETLVLAQPTCTGPVRLLVGLAKMMRHKLECNNALRSEWRLLSW